jgi:hypothetical protein
MGFGPTQESEDYERYYEEAVFDYSIPDELIGKSVKTLDELAKLIPADEQHSDVFERKDSFGITRYSRNLIINRKEKSYRNVAYFCLECNEIQIGFPIVKSFNTIRDMAGSSGLEYYCRSKEHLIERNEIVIS